MTAWLLGLGVIALGGVLVWAIPHAARGRRALTTSVTLGGALAALPAVRVLLTGEPVSMRLAMSVPGGDWVFGLDPLSSIFLLGILAVGVAATFFGAAYFAGDHDATATRFSHVLAIALILALAVVVAAQSVLPFLCAWEVMAISSYLLIVTEREHAEVRQAGLLYLVLTHAGTLALFVMFAIWTQGAADWSFAALATAAPTLPHGADAIFALAIVGFGVKAGMVPFHFWLPPAHAAAPSHISAIMSGIVIKTGVYGLLRVVVIAGGAPPWWGWTLLTLGTVSSVLGVLWALAQHDLKRLLAYHSVENIGIILIGIGIGALGATYGHPTIAVLGYAAAALHTLNHALFKSVLFFGAGAVYRATETRNLEELGGLARKMPAVTLSFVVGAAAIIGVPPLNGFVSEWLVYQGLFAAGISGGVMRPATFVVPLLALVGGLALACFVKVVGVVFLGTARSAHARTIRALPPGLAGPPLVLAAACVVLGLLPVLVMPSLLRVGAQIAALPSASAGVQLGHTLVDAQRVSVFAFAISLLVATIWLWRRSLLRTRHVTEGPTWGCGFERQTPRMQYTASSFATPLLDAFGGMSGVRTHRGAFVFHTTAVDLVRERLVVPLWTHVREWALHLRAIQHGRLHVYLLYVIVTLVAVLAYFVFWPA